MCDYAGIFQQMLWIHIAGAGATGLTVLMALFSVFGNKMAHLGVQAKLLGLLTLLQLISGSVLAYLHQHSGSLLTFCSNLAVYLAIIIATEMMLAKKMRQQDNGVLFPTKTVVPTIATSLIPVAFVIIVYAR